MKYVILIAFLFLANGVAAQPGSIDKSFGYFNWVITDFGQTDQIKSIAMQKDGKILAVGSSIVDPFDLTQGSKIALSRYLIDGSLDSSFGKNGKVLQKFGSQIQFGNSIIIKEDGKIIIGGTDLNSGAYDFFMLQFNEDGSLDSSFGAYGKAAKFFTSIYSDMGYYLALQTDYKIVVAGTTYQNATGYDFLVARYTMNGKPDSSFGHEGYVTKDFAVNQADYALCVAIQVDGNIIVAGYSQGSSYPHSAIVRYNINGILDTTFAPGSGGLSIDDAGIFTIHLLQNGKILAGSFYSESPVGTAWLRYNSNGTLDSSFGASGSLRANIVYEGASISQLALCSNDKMVLCGTTAQKGTNDFVVWKFNVDGGPDKSFGLKGKVITDNNGNDDHAIACGIQSDGKIVVGGYSNSDFALLRYNSDGSIDRSFGNPNAILNSKSIGDDIANTISISSNDQILLGGYSDVSINDVDLIAIRYNLSGSVDSTFSRTGYLLNEPGDRKYLKINSAITQSDTAIYFGGDIYNPVQFTTDFTIVGYSPLFQAFIQWEAIDFGSGFNYCQSLLKQSDGKFVASGYAFTDRNYDFALLRYNNTGSGLDESFGTNGKVTTDIGVNQDYAYASALQTDGKIILCGTTYNDKQWQIALIRYNSDGSLDQLFGSSGIVLTALHDSDDEAKSIAIQSDGKIVVAGYTRDNKKYNFALLRYNMNGNLDSSFGKFGIAETPIGIGDAEANGVVIESDGKIVAAGYSSNGKDDDFTLACYNSNGSLDKNFGTGGITTTDFGFGDDHCNAVALQSDGAIVAAGYAFNGTDKDYAVARYLPDLNLGVIDRKLPQHTTTIYPNPIHNTATLQYELTKSQPITIKLYDILGNEIAVFINDQIRNEGKNSEQIIFPNGIPVGSYYLRIETNEGVVSVKVIKSEP